MEWGSINELSFKCKLKTGRMKNFLFGIFLLFTGSSFSQSGVEIGLNLSPGYRVLLSKQVGTGLRSSQSGFGFTAGVPVKYWLNEFTSINTGLNYEFTAFDTNVKGLLLSSFRINSVSLPLVFNLHLNRTFYLMAGTGVNYNFAARDINIFGGADLTHQMNKIQPYLALGANSLIERGDSNLEVGVVAHYQLLDIWKKSYTAKENFNSHIASINFVLQYYFN